MIKYLKVTKKLRMLNSYLKIKDWEKKNNAQIYKNLGVETLRKTIMNIVDKLGLEERPDNYFIGNTITEESLTSFQEKTKSNELTHLPQIPAFLLIAIYLLSEGHYDIGAFSLLLCGLNTGCVAVQRYNRARIDNILEKKFNKDEK